MKSNNKIILLTILILILFIGTGCELSLPELSAQSEDENAIKASGTVEAVEA
ncbi:MAG: hypothetical protein ISR58_22340, partial [Anaerolineales bacterium]|nr:hypothetical protein [Anaerolineales bacterium]